MFNYMHISRKETAGPQGTDTAVNTAISLRGMWILLAIAKRAHEFLSSSLKINSKTSFPNFWDSDGYKRLFNLHFSDH